MMIKMPRILIFRLTDVTMTFINFLFWKPLMPLYDDDAETVRCTRCGKYILEDSECCPYCRHYQLADERNRKPLWLILTAILCIFLIGGYLLFNLMELLPWRLK